MARDNGGFACHHHRHYVSYEVHHVFPKCYGGEDIIGNRIKICPNAHSDIHYLMDRMLAGKPYDPREYGPAVRRYALEGFQHVQARIDGLIGDRG